MCRLTHPKDWHRDSQLRDIRLYMEEDSLLILKHCLEGKVSSLTHIQEPASILSKDGGWWTPIIQPHTNLWVPSLNSMLHSNSPVSPKKKLVPTSGTLVFVAATKGHIKSPVSVVSRV